MILILLRLAAVVSRSKGHMRSLGTQPSFRLHLREASFGGHPYHHPQCPMIRSPHAAQRTLKRLASSSLLSRSVFRTLTSSRATWVACCTVGNCGYITSAPPTAICTRLTSEYLQAGSISKWHHNSPQQRLSRSCVATKLRSMQRPFSETISG